MKRRGVTAPLLLILEDLHDADRGTLDLLVHFARRLGDARLLVVGTYRDVEVGRTHPLSGALAELRRAVSFERVLLHGLSPDDVQRLMERLAGRELPWSLAQAVHRQTEGNPLFVQEVLRYLVEEGRIGDGGPGRAGESDLFAAGIPEGLRDVIGRRLSRLSQECNRVLAVAAVIGREFDLETLQAVAGVDEEVLLGALEEAVRAAIVQEQSRVGGVRYRFAHAFFRQTLYEELIAPRRLRLHQQVARALEAQHTRRLDEHAAELAEHFAHSTDPADLAKAVAYGERAAERASSVYAHGEAVRLLEQALQVQEVLDPDDRARRCDLLLALGEALLPEWEPHRVADDVAPQTLALADALGDRRRAWRACDLALTALARYGDEMVAATPEYRRWAELADHHAEAGSVERVRADIARSNVELLAGHDTESRFFRVRALEQARTLGDRQALLAAVARMVDWPGAPQRWEERLRLVEEFASWSRAGLSPYEVGWFLFRGGCVLLDYGGRDRAEAFWHELDELAERTHDTTLTLFRTRRDSILALVDGRLEDALALSERLRAQGEEVGAPVRGWQFSVAVTNRAMLYLGRHEDQLDFMREWFKHTPSETPLSTKSFSARSLAHLGRHAEAHAILHEWLTERGVAQPENETSAQAMVALLETAVALEDREATAALLERLSGLAGLATVDNQLTCAGRHLGAAAALLGDHDQARAYTRQALEAAERIRFRPEIALARLQLAELLYEGSIEERSQARTHVEFAFAEFEAMGMQPSLERARRLQAHLGGERPAKTVAHNPDGLSDREVEVLRGIAAGRSNQEIADALVVSVRTVERHAVNIYAKIGARGRTDAVAYAVRHNLADASPD